AAHSLDHFPEVAVVRGHSEPEDGADPDAVEDRDYQGVHTERGAEAHEKLCIAPAEPAEWQHDQANHKRGEERHEAVQSAVEAHRDSVEDQANCGEGVRNLVVDFTLTPVRHGANDEHHGNRNEEEELLP